MIFMLCGAVKLKALLSKGVATSGMVFLKMPRLDHHPVILDLKSFGIRLNYYLKYLNYPLMSYLSSNVFTYSYALSSICLITCSISLISFICYCFGGRF